MTNALSTFRNIASQIVPKFFIEQPLQKKNGNIFKKYKNSMPKAPAHSYKITA